MIVEYKFGEVHGFLVEAPEDPPRNTTFTTIGRIIRVQDAINEQNELTDLNGNQRNDNESESTHIQQTPLALAESLMHHQSLTLEMDQHLFLLLQSQLFKILTLDQVLTRWKLLLMDIVLTHR